MLRRWMAIILSVTMVFTLVPTSTYAETSTFSDMPDHWSTAALESAVGNGLLKGSNGKIMPQENLTRAQMATVINRAFGSYVTVSLDGFTDVSREEWYYSEMAKAVAMGTFQGSGNNLDPNDPITREQAFAVIARALNLGSSIVAPAGFSDLSDLSSWATGEVYSLINNGYIQGADGKLNPQGYITRAEFAQVMDNIIKKYVRMPGEYTLDVVGNVMITMPGVILSDSTITGDLIIGDGVFEGDATLDNVEVTGRLLVRGGGTNSISITGGSVIGSITVAKVNGAIRVYAEDGTEIGEVVVDGKDDVILEGIFADIAILSDDITVWATNATIDTLTVEGDDTSLVIGEGSTVEKLVLKGVGTEVEVSGIVAQILVEESAEDTVITVDEDGEVEEIIVNSAGTLIEGEGKVEDIQANADNVVVETEGTKVTAGDDTECVMAGDKEVEAGRSIVVGEDEEEPSSSGGGGSAGGGSTTPPEEDDDTNSPPDGDEDDQEIEEGLTISGIISLPNNEVAPEGGIVINLRINKSPRETPISKSIVIPEGSNAKDYSVSVEEGSYSIWYYLSDNSDYIRNSYYREEGTTVDPNEATQISIVDSSIEGIDIEILKGQEVSGLISLPDGEHAPEGGIFINLSIEGENQFASYAIIPEGENSVEYSIRAVDGDYKLEYSVSQFDTTEYIQKGFYGDSGATSDLETATVIELAGEDLTGLDIELIKGHRISGVLSLAGSRIAPEGGMDLDINLIGANDYYSTITIPEGENSVEYSIRVPDGEYIIMYKPWENDDYVKWAYYNESGVVSSSIEATQIIVLGEDIPYIDMEIVEGNLVSGELLLPEGLQNPMNGSVTIDVKESNNSWSTPVRSMDLVDDSPIDYEVRLLDGEYRFSVISYHDEMFNGRLYYNSSQTTPDIRYMETVMLPFDEGITIDMNLYKKVLLESTYPIDGQQNYYPLYSYLTLEFSEEMRDLTSRELGRIGLTSESGEVVTISEVAAGISDKTNILIIVNDSLELDTNYTLNIPADTIKSVNEIPYKEQIEINFKTAHTVLKGKISFDNGISGSKLELIDAEGSVIEEKTLTDGGYRFVNMDGGEYSLRVTMINGDVYTNEIMVVAQQLNQIDMKIVPAVNDYTVTTDGGIKVVEADVALYEAESTLWAPLRFLAEAFNWEVYWDSIESTATLVDGSNSVEVSLVSGYLVINQDRSFCDLEYVSQALGYDLSWDLDLKSITMMKQ